MADPIQPKKAAPTVADEVADLRATVANLQKLLAAQQPVLQPVKVAQDREAEFQAKVAEYSKSCQQRTQEEAERRWGADTALRYPVSVADVPEVRVPARSPEEARGRFDVLCGINSVDQQKHKYRIGSPVRTEAAA